MTGDTRASGRGLSRLLRRLGRNLLAVLVSPAITARRRSRDRRLAAGIQADPVTSALELPVPSPPVTDRARAAGPPSAGAGVPRTMAMATPASGISPPPRVPPPPGELYHYVRVDAAFGARGYAATFATLQHAPGCKLLDLTPARMLSVEVFEHLAASWTAPPGTVPRLGILLSFERWVMLRDEARAALAPLAGAGVAAEVLYEEQAWGMCAAVWFALGNVIHNVPAVLGSLARRRRPSSAIWPMVIDTLRDLVRTHYVGGEVPDLLTQIAALSLSCGGADQAAALAREALYHLLETPNAIRSRALRELGAALVEQGQTEAGMLHFDQAITVAESARDPVGGASALCQSGLCALNHGDYANAERRFRRAIELLAPSVGRPHLLASAHHSLAIALMYQGCGEAEYHLRTAMELRPDPHSNLAEEDRILLDRLREQQMALN
jgi:tetratricopeptide (TPR) repeat protein